LHDIIKDPNNLKILKVGIKDKSFILDVMKKNLTINK